MGRFCTRVLAAGVAACALGSIIGCGSTTPSSTDGGFRNVPADRIATDVFRTDKLAGLEELHQASRADCMAARGYPQVARAGAAGGSPVLTALNVTPPEFATRSEADAQRLGFGWNEPRQAAHAVSFDPGFDAALDRCSDAASRAIDQHFPRVRGKMYDLMNTVSVEIGRRSATGPAAATFDRIAAPLLDCLDRSGFRPADGAPRRSLDAYRVGVPTGQLTGADPAGPNRVPGTVQMVPAVPERVYLPPPAESALAVAAARCARATGYAEQFVAARLELTRQVIAEHVKSLARLARQIDTMAARQQGRLDRVRATG